MTWRAANILFAATGISDSAMLPGIRHEEAHAITHSILMRAKHQTVRYIRRSTTWT
jgi:fructose-1,6-bisphosphatase/sedoheptulose 1,7-bisphosphatase-like protein